MTTREAPRIRRAKAQDLGAVLELERICFQDYRRAGPASLARSLSHRPHQRMQQSFWVVDHPNRAGLASLLILWHFPHSVRIYDVATAPDARGHGLGSRLVAHAESLARKAGATRVTLEAEEADKRLVKWYRELGYVQTELLKDFYHPGCHAVRMVKASRPRAP